MKRLLPLCPCQSAALSADSTKSHVWQAGRRGACPSLSLQAAEGQRQQAGTAAGDAWLMQRQLSCRMTSEGAMPQLHASYCWPKQQVAEGGRGRDCGARRGGRGKRGSERGGKGGLSELNYCWPWLDEVLEVWGIQRQAAIPHGQPHIVCVRV